MVSIFNNFKSYSTQFIDEKYIGNFIGINNFTLRNAILTVRTNSNTLINTDMIVTELTSKTKTKLNHYSSLFIKQSAVVTGIKKMNSNAINIRYKNGKDVKLCLVKSGKVFTGVGSDWVKHPSSKEDLLKLAFDES